MILRLGLRDVKHLILCTWSFMFLENFMFLVAHNLFFDDVFNFHFYSRTDVLGGVGWLSWGYSIVFSYVKAVSSNCLRSRCLISCLEAEGDSSVISIRVEERESVTNRSYVFRIRVWKDNVFLDFLIFGGGVIVIAHIIIVIDDVLVCIFFAY